MKFSDAIQLIKIGKKIRRKGWNGKEMYIFDFYNSAIKLIADFDYIEEIFDISELTNVIQIGGRRYI